MPSTTRVSCVYIVHDTCTTFCRYEFVCNSQEDRSAQRVYDLFVIKLQLCAFKPQTVQHFVLAVVIQEYLPTVL